MTTRLRTLCLLAPLLLLSACSGLLPHADPQDVYRLPAAAASAPATAASSDSSLQIEVDTPQADGMLQSKRIVVLPDGNRLSVYHGARWNQPPPLMLRDRLIDSFRRSGRLHAVFGDDAGLHADYVVDGTLDAFQSEYGGAATPTAVIRFNALLIRGVDHAVVATRQFEQRVPVEGTDVPAVVQAFGQASDRLSARLVDWAMPKMSEADAAGD